MSEETSRMVEYRRARLERAGTTLPGRSYASDEVFAEEVERIFYGQWFCIGRAEQIAAPREYLLAQVASENLLVLRDRAGVARAFYNVCRHRGARLCTEPRGHLAETIQCPYHAWTYTLDGHLLAARHMQDVEGFDKGAYPLYGVAVAEWDGFLFLNLSSHPQPFEAVFAPLLGKFAAWLVGGLRCARRVEYQVKANWKLIVENYSECYHCPLIHPALDRLSPSDSGRNDLLEGPFLGGYMDLNHAGGSMTLTGATTRPPLGDLAGPDLNRVYYYSIFPNLLLSLHPDYVMAHVLWPEQAGSTRVVCEWYFDPAAMARDDFDPEDAVEFWDMTNRQDWHACE
ncbi:MAG TPA: aromatic ring-hydroxylating dioxygenase subunit alpha, partial [Ardenticatenaceae bacterium]|nr:aromatic ring-hydroxylating dioxygenase subunit alpha [Ardenticatenaceae bacterium]